MSEISASAPAISEAVLTTAWFESIDAPMLLCDQQLVVLAANPAATALLQRSEGELLHRKADALFDPSAAAIPKPNAPPAPRLEWKCDFETPEGRRTVAVSGIALKDRVTGVQGWALSLHPISADAPPPFIGRSAVAQELLEFVSRIAASRAASILLVGESGTGKELIAKRLHALSRRSAAPLIAINCAALPEPLLESELFGFEKGAFTGARESKEGLLEVADGGTVFLDEIGELPVALQAKLLRVLEDHTFRRVGGSRNTSVNVRVIGATNADLERALAERRFRSDLYHRLNGVQIRIPTLRERPEDIAELTSHFLEHFNRLHEKSITGIHPTAQGLLDRYTWPGNVRELRNVLERAVLTEISPLITVASLAVPNGSNRLHGKPVACGLSSRAAHFSLLSGERELIAAALAETRGNQTRAASLLGIGRFSLRYRMKRLGLR